MSKSKLPLKSDFTANSVEKDELLPKIAFLRKYRISSATFAKTELNWQLLKKIHAHYLSNQEVNLNAAQAITNRFLSPDGKSVGIHSVRFRLKSPEGLIEKIIRKTYEAKTKGKGKNPVVSFKAITLKNYTHRITDIIGVRVLHVFKNDWYSIQDYLLNDCKYKTIENPIAYFRKGDSKQFVNDCKRYGCIPKVHPKAYRSIHYIIDPYPGKNIFVEIQVRTVFEDGWSEIDHKLRYFNKQNIKNKLDSYLLALNRIAGSADEIGTIIRNRQAEIDQEKYEKTNKVLRLK